MTALSETYSPVRVRDMPWDQMLALIRSIGGEVATLALRGDRLAQAVRVRYQYAHDHPRDRKANFELRVAVEDYMNRDLRTAEVAELGSRLGHRLSEPEKECGPRIFVPGPEKAQ